MDNLPQIEEWRRTLTLSQRFDLNHPNAVLRRWKAFMRPETRPEPGAEPKPTLRDRVANLSEESVALKAHIAELEAARDEATDADARSRHAEDLRGLLGRVLDEVAALPPELRAAIEAALRD